MNNSRKQLPERNFVRIDALQARNDCLSKYHKDLSFIIDTSGQIIPAIPEGNEFSLQQIRDYVAGPPELLFETHDGFFLFQNKEGEARGLPENRFASAMYLKTPQRTNSLVGKIFVAHPDHIAAYLKSK